MTTASTRILDGDSAATPLVMAATDTQRREHYRRNAMAFYSRYHTGDPDAVDEILAPEWTNHPRRIGEPAGPDGFKAVIAALRGAFPDIHFAVEAAVAEGETVAVRALGTGTHTGAAFGPPTGKAVRFRTLDMHRFRPDGMIVATWHAEDLYGLLATLGLIPEVYGAQLDPYPDWE